MTFASINDNSSGTLYLLCDECGSIVYLAKSKQGIRVEERGVYKIICDSCGKKGKKEKENVNN